MPEIKDTGKIRSKQNGDCREGTFKLIESGEPFYPRHLSEDSKDLHEKGNNPPPPLPLTPMHTLSCPTYATPPPAALPRLPQPLWPLNPWAPCPLTAVRLCQYIPLGPSVCICCPLLPGSSPLRLLFALCPLALSATLSFMSGAYRRCSTLPYIGSCRSNAARCPALCCAVLCCAVLCCAVLCCAVLCCAVLLLPQYFGLVTMVARCGEL